MIKKMSLFDAFKNAMMNNPKGSRKEAFDHFLETVKSDPRYLAALAEDYFYRQTQNWDLDQNRLGSSLVATPAQRKRAEVSAAQRAASAARVAKATDEIKARIRKVIMLDLTLPNGKKLRDCTGAECAKAGGFYTEVSKHIKATEIVDKHLSERNLQDLYSRFSSKPASRRSTAELRASA